MQQCERETLTVIVIVTNDELLDLPVFAHLTPNVLVERVEMILHLRRVHLIPGKIRWVLVKVWEENGLAVGGFDMLSTTAVAVSTCADLVVETAINLVLFGTENAREIIGHDCFDTEV